MPETVEAEIKRHQSEFRRLSNQLKSVADIKLGQKNELEQLTRTLRALKNSPALHSSVEQLDSLTSK